MKTEDKKSTYNSDVTTDDLQALGEKTKNTRTDNGDDSQLKDRDRKVDFAGKDLDVPGRKLPQIKSENSLKDEENQLYSQGGAENEDLEQNTDHIV
ncbi:hypothetical protein SAMN05192540_3085 [Maribacter dokdonensis]|uniref:Uncharacterized protein n=1 Tax=Maribacter dokdonensis TaxID=320912 RepID=A0A1H4S8X3_9FLAO|nr:hypothetical protein [Maribacter dokdonensis]SEC40301.1 hypothetical protein SAMN05192540_3085 [Maribacter dokdonensis]